MFNREPFEPLSPEVLEENGLLTYQEAINMIHFPSDALELKMARRRLAFDELLLLQLGFGTMKVKSRKNTGCTMHSIEMDEFFDRLPFTMTKGQLSAIEDITHDMCSTTPMNRLIQGDVGSGKTAVAMAGCYFAYKNGFQSTIMAPTEILAQQHYETFKSLLEPLGMRVGLLTGSLTQKNKKLVRQQIADGELDVVTGTHALVQKDTIFQNLGLVITDEQHRFGVSQRAKLSSKGNYPHTLVMSATPIPRTLGLIIYGDLDISPIKELPAGRQPIETYAVMGKLRERAYNYVVKHLKEGGQAYIVCPTIEENEMELQSVYAYAENLKDSVLGRYNIGILHGRMSQEEKDTIMLRFKIGIIDILISTTVIEVGVDVPNASIILIENAERFGLSQLHQLRGRVGRGSRKSACILLCNNYTDDAKERLRAMCNTTDGFEIAEKDLEIRGYGDFFGHRQHGLPSLKVANLVNDSQILDQSKVTAQKILSDDPTLSKIENAILASQVARMFDTSSST
jgi:ATP-dependent DNA helicase RecG